MLISLCALISGCITTPRPNAPQLFDTHPLNEPWQARGKLAVRATDPQSLGLKKSSYTLSFNWQQKINEYEIDLVGALGFGRARIKGNSVNQSIEINSATNVNSASDSQVQLFRGERLIDQSDRASTLFKRQTGIELPVEWLRFWLQGIPAPSAKALLGTHSSSDISQASILGFKQEGWTVNYVGYHTVDGVLLPKKITAYNAQFKIVLAVKQWQLL